MSRAELEHDADRPDLTMGGAEVLGDDDEHTSHTFLYVPDLTERSGFSTHRVPERKPERAPSRLGFRAMTLRTGGMDDRTRLGHFLGAFAWIRGGAVLDALIGAIPALARVGLGLAGGPRVARGVGPARSWIGTGHCVLLHGRWTPASLCVMHYRLAPA